jgi:hypothetical protein
MAQHGGGRGGAGTHPRGVGEAAVLVCRHCATRARMGATACGAGTYIPREEEEEEEEEGDS